MRTQNLSSAGKAPKAIDYRVIAVYEPDTGKIRHLHTVTVFEGGRTVSEQEAVNQALESAVKAGHKTENLKAKTSRERDHGSRPHRIDVSSGNFVPLTVKPPFERPKR